MVLISPAYAAGPNGVVYDANGIRMGPLGTIGDQYRKDAIELLVNGKKVSLCVEPGFGGDPSNKFVDTRIILPAFCYGSTQVNFDQPNCQGAAYLEGGGIYYGGIGRYPSSTIVTSSGVVTMYVAQPALPVRRLVSSFLSATGVCTNYVGQGTINSLTVIDVINISAKYTAPYVLH